MTIVYRDGIGNTALYVEDPCEVAFCGGFAYWTDDDGNDYQIPVSDLVEIINYKAF